MEASQNHVVVRVMPEVRYGYIPEKTEEAMFRLRVVLLFTSEDKILVGGQFCSDNVT